jgi:hypothetical protein
MCEMQVNVDLIENAANMMPQFGEDSYQNSCKRLITSAIYTIC